MHLRRTLGTAAASAAVLASLGTALATPAAAATPTQSSIDGQFARDRGCRADQQVIFHKLIQGDGQTWGYVDLITSNYCHAVWAQIHGVRVVANQTYVPQGFIHRNSDGRSYGCTAGEGTQDCFTKMVWDKGVTSYAHGAVDPNGATNTIYTANTGSY